MPENILGYTINMQEYVSEAIVLEKKTFGDCDSRYSIFTRRFGKMVAKAKSVRKITSKLAGHLEPGNIVRVRFIEKNGLQITDALKEEKLFISLMNLSLLSDLLPEGEPEVALWANCRAGVFVWRDILRTLGWDPEYATCVSCGSSDVSSFYIPSQEFFCGRCSSSKSGKNEIPLKENDRL